MNDDHIQKIIDKNFQITMLLGVATAIITDLYEFMPPSHRLQQKIEWLDKAIECAIYLDCSPPEMPRERQ